MAKGNGHDMHEDEILSDVEIVHALALIRQFKTMVQLLPIHTYSQEDYYDEYANEIVEAVLKMKEEGYDPDIIKFEIAELLYSKDIFKFN